MAEVAEEVEERSAARGAGLAPGTLRVMSVAAGVAVANIYYVQPLLADIGRGFGRDAGGMGLVATLTQVGYALGMLLFVPLGDTVERRSLVVATLGAAAVALSAAALAPGYWWLAGASLAVGLTSVVPQLLVPFASSLSRPEARGRAVGTIMTGLLVGILLSRTVSGFVGARAGWRAMYWIAAALMLALAAVLRRLLPVSRAAGASTPYPRLLGSIWGVARANRVVRESAAVGFLAFGAFSAFWATLAFLVASPRFGMGSEAAGMFGLVGVAGAGAAAVVGRLADARDPKETLAGGLAIALVSYLIFLAFGGTIAGLVVGVILLDLGVQGAHVSNQSRIFALPAEVHGRVNTFYMVSYFLGGSLGSSLGAYGWAAWGWPGVCAVGIGMLVAALGVFALARRR